MITKATGIQVVKAQGPGFDYVGNWNAADIDQNATDYTPNDELTGGLNWITNLFADQKGKTLAGLTTEEELNGLNAMYWYLIRRFLKRSQAGKSCPDDRCKTDADYKARLNFAKEMICEYLDAAGLTDSTICDYVNNAGTLQGFYTEVNYNCK